MAKPPAAGVILAVAIATAGVVFGTLQWRASTATIEAGFWFDEFPFTLPDNATAKLGGPLRLDEVAVIKRIARQEVERAFAGLRIVVSESPDAFWRVRVLREIRRAGGV